MQQTIVYELNEVPTRLFDFYADAFKSSAFAKLKQFGSCIETKSPDVGHLSPWVTWPTLHRGVSNVEHQISDLGQDVSKVNIEMPNVWDILANEGVSVGVFGSLHSYPLPVNLDNYSFYVPDTFAAGDECFPELLTSFQRFNLSMVRANGRNVQTGIAAKDAASFIKNSVALGLKPATFFKLTNQVISEQFKKERVVRRRTSQAEIAFDLFFAQFRKSMPMVSFFFTNHVASSMHRYWPTIFPDDYSEGKFDELWIKKWSGEIPHAVRVANYQLGKLIEHCDRFKSNLLVVSSMGQAAVETEGKIDNQVLITNVKALMNFIGCKRSEWEPRLAMAPQVVVKPNSPDVYKKLRKLDNVLINGEKMQYFLTAAGDIRFEIHQQNVDNLIISHDSQPINHFEIGISIVALQDAAGANAYHIPEGVLISYTGQGNKKPTSQTWEHNASTEDFAPSLLKKFNLNKRSYMLGRDDLFVN